MKCIAISEKLRNLVNIEAKTTAEKILQPHAAPIEAEDAFHGTSIGVCIAKTNREITEVLAKPKSWDEYPDDEILEMLNNGSKYGIEPKAVTQYVREEDSLVTRYFWFVLYQPVISPLDRPTVTDNFVDHISNAHYEVEIELTLVEEEGLSRIITYHGKTKNIAPFTLINDLFESVLEDLDEEDLIAMFPDDPDVFRIETDDNEETGFCVPYYDRFGVMIKVCYRNAERIRVHINSMRVVKCEMIIEN